MNDSTKREIDRIAQQILDDARLKSPPFEVEEILSHLKVHRDFYNLDDPTLIQKFSFKMKIGAERVTNLLKTKLKLSAIWVPPERRILVDKSQPAPKQEWASFHDAIHSVLPWHREFYLGDTASTLDPDYQEQLESEANYGASALMFGGAVFTKQALDTSPSWAAIEDIKKIHKKSYVTTVRRYVEHGHRIPMVMMVSTAMWDRKPDDQISRCRHFVSSPEFRRAFPAFGSGDLLKLVDSFCRRRRGGPVGEFTFRAGPPGDGPELRAECFYNAHYVITLVVPA